MRNINVQHVFQGVIILDISSTQIIVWVVCQKLLQTESHTFEHTF